MHGNLNTEYQETINATGIVKISWGSNSVVSTLQRTLVLKVVHINKWSHCVSLGTGLALLAELMT